MNEYGVICLSDIKSGNVRLFISTNSSQSKLDIGNLANCLQCISILSFGRLGHLILHLGYFPLLSHIHLIGKSKSLFIAYFYLSGHSFRIIDLFCLFVMVFLKVDFQQPVHLLRHSPGVPCLLLHQLIDAEFCILLMSLFQLSPSFRLFSLFFPGKESKSSSTGS